MQRPGSAAVDLYWIPLAAGGHCVGFNGRVYEALVAARRHRRRSDLHHAALVVELEGDRYTIEVAPSPDDDEASRGVVATGAVGSRLAGRRRLFRYEVRCWRAGSIPDLRYAVGRPSRVESEPQVARRLLDLVAAVPTPVWGRGELETGDMWNSNSVIAWLLATAGVPTDRPHPPPRGRAPGWHAGLEIARRNAASDPPIVRLAAPRLGGKPAWACQASSSKVGCQCASQPKEFPDDDAFSHSSCRPLLPSTRPHGACLARGNGGDHRGRLGPRG
jgi:hypothetical protein